MWWVSARVVVSPGFAAGDVTDSAGASPPLDSLRLTSSPFGGLGLGTADRVRLLRQRGQLGGSPSRGAPFIAITVPATALRAASVAAVACPLRQFPPRPGGAVRLSTPDGRRARRTLTNCKGTRVRFISIDDMFTVGVALDLLGGLRRTSLAKVRAASATAGRPSRDQLLQSEEICRRWFREDLLAAANLACARRRRLM